MRKCFYILFFISSIIAKAQIITTVAGNGTQGFNGDNGLAINAELYSSVSVFFDKAGNLFIADLGNKRIRKVNTTNVITTIAGTGINGFNGDNILATTAELYDPINVITDDTGNIYISDYQNHRIRKINSSGIITTIAGTGIAGFSGDNGTATSAKINYPSGMVFDTTGNLIFSDTYNNRIRKINNSGIITTIAGNGIAGYFGDNGSSTSAQLNLPSALTFDLAGNLYFADFNNSVIRKINSLGIITTIAGNGTAGFSGDNGPAISAQLNLPFGIICDGIGNIYTSDSYNHRIRKINTSGIITTIAGTGIAGYNGDNISATTAELYYPEGITLDDTGNLYVADNYNNRIRKVANVAVVINEIIKTNQATVYPNPTTNIISLNISTTYGFQNSIITIKSTIGQIVKKFSFTKKIDVSDLAEGVYFLQITLPTEEIYITKFIKQ